MMGNLQGMVTNDKTIRFALKKDLSEQFQKKSDTIIVDEFGLNHGEARVDIAVINGVIHGYELKSDIDSLYRLPDQMLVYNSILDKVTLIVGRKHLYEAIKLVPDWWGITIAKPTNSIGGIEFHEIRSSNYNPIQDSVAIAKLLWRDEALNILEDLGQAKSMKSKPRSQIYEKLVSILDQKDLKNKVRKYISSRRDWRSGQLCMSNDN